MADKQTAENGDPSPENKDFQFPYEWVAQHCDAGDASFAMSKELAAKFAQLKMMNEEADLEATNVLKSLQSKQEEYEKSVQAYDDILKDLPVKIQDLPPDTQLLLGGIAQQISMRSDVPGDSDVLEELAYCNYEKDLAGMQKISQSLDMILDQIDSMKQQFLAEFSECEEESEKQESSESVEFLEEKAAACKQEYNGEEAEKFFAAFKEFKEVKSYLAKLEKEKQVEAKLDAALARYKDLPPDLELAKAALKRQEKEMKDLNAEIEFLKNNMDEGSLEMFKP